MNWDAVGAVGQVLGSVAVFITLVYLAVQTNHTKRELQRSINQSRAEGITRLFLDMANNERLGQVVTTLNEHWGQSATPPVVATTAARGGISSLDAWMMNMYQQASWQLRSQTIIYIDELPQGVRDSFDLTCRIEYSPGTWHRFWYESTKATLNQDAVRYLDRLLAGPPPIPVHAPAQRSSNLPGASATGS
jgi:hypothetical protein